MIRCCELELVFAFNDPNLSFLYLALFWFCFASARLLFFLFSRGIIR